MSAFSMCHRLSEPVPETVSARSHDTRSVGVGRHRHRLRHRWPCLRRDPGANRSRGVGRRTSLRSGGLTRRSNATVSAGTWAYTTSGKWGLKATPTISSTSLLTERSSLPPSAPSTTPSIFRITSNCSSRGRKPPCSLNPRNASRDRQRRSTPSSSRSPKPTAPAGRSSQSAPCRRRSPRSTGVVLPEMGSPHFM